MTEIKIQELLSPMITQRRINKLVSSFSETQINKSPPAGSWTAQKSPTMLQNQTLGS
jgi:hypothetical protein